MTSRWLADAILRGIDIESISLSEIHFGTDQSLWDKLILHEDPIIQQNMKRVLHPQRYFSFTDFDDADLIIKSKFRGIDPWILVETKVQRLTEVDDEIRTEFAKTKQKHETGWAIKLLDP